MFQFNIFFYLQKNWIYLHNKIPKCMYHTWDDGYKQPMQTVKKKRKYPKNCLSARNWNRTHFECVECFLWSIRLHFFAETIFECAKYCAATAICLNIVCVVLGGKGGLSNQCEKKMYSQSQIPMKHSFSFSLVRYSAMEYAIAELYFIPYFSFSFYVFFCSCDAIRLYLFYLKFWCFFFCYSLTNWINFHRWIQIRWDFICHACINMMFDMCIWGDCVPDVDSEFVFEIRVGNCSNKGKFAFLFNHLTFRKDTRAYISDDVVVVRAFIHNRKYDNGRFDRRLHQIRCKFNFEGEQFLFLSKSA